MNPAPSPDQALIDRIHQRDASALDDVYERFGRPAYSLAYRIVGDAHTAEDVIQEVFLRLWQNPERYVPERGALGSWLLSVTHNRSIDVLRRRRVRDEKSLLDSPGLLETLSDGLLDPSDVASQKETAVAIREALTSIPDAQRRAIEMAFFEGKTHVEISEELGEPLGTAKTRIRLGMRKLKSLLEERGVGI